MRSIYLKTFRQIVKNNPSRWEITRLFDFPALVNEFAEMAVESAEFDKLFELVVTALEKRKGEAPAPSCCASEGSKSSQPAIPMRRSRS